jgi:hypothetical protein
MMKRSVQARANAGTGDGEGDIHGECGHVGIFARQRGDRSRPVLFNVVLNG